ncbi:MAG: SCP2 sterol-binding domain-containing protein [Methanomassiliicoccales archaeon]
MGETYRFPSREWFERYVEEINSSEAYQEAAKDWEGDFLFVVAPDRGLDQEFVYYLDLYHGQVRDHRPVDDRKSQETEFMLIGKYGKWRKLMDGRADVMKAVLTGKLKLKGNMSKAMRYTQAANELLKAAQRVPTE